MAYELENAFIKMLDEREDFTSTSFVPTRTLERRKGWSVEDAIDLSGIEDPYFQDLGEEKGKPEEGYFWDVVGASLWSFTDSLLWGLPTAAHKGFGAEPDKELAGWMTPDTTVAKVASGVAGFAGFVAPLPFAPIRLGAKIATGVGRAAIGTAGKIGLTSAKTLGSATARSLKKVSMSPGMSEAGNLFAKNMSKTARSWTNMGRWKDKLGMSWEKFAFKNIDDLTNMGVKSGKIATKEADIIRKVFKQNFKDRPMIDLVDVIMRNRPTQAGFAMGSMLHEGVMFGAIDALMETSHLWGEGKLGDGEFDWTAPLWGVGTGAAFGAMKFWPGHGKLSNTWNDFKGGWKSWAKKDSFAKMDKKTLVENTKILGTELKHGMNGKASFIVEYEHKGVMKTLDMTNPESYLSGYTDAEAATILKSILRGKQEVIGKMMMKESIWEDLRSSRANWKHMIGGSIIMNAKSIWAISQGQDVPLEDFLTSVFLGAFVNRKGGGGKTYDIMQNEMMSLRRSLEVLGESSNNWIDRFPSGSSGSMNKLNPLNYGQFNRVREIAREFGITSDEAKQVEFMSQDGSDSVAVEALKGQADFSLFNHVYSFLHGASGERHIKSRDKITANEARSIERAIKEVEYTVDGESFKLSTIDNLNKALRDISNRIHDRVEDEAIHFIQDIMNTGDLVYYDAGARSMFPANEFGLQNIGFIPERVKISDKLFTDAEKGKLDWLVDPKSGEVLKGEEARFRLAEIQQKLDAGFEFMQWMPGRSEYYRDSRRAGYIENSKSLAKVYEAILNKENTFNAGFKINKPWLKFGLEHLEEMALPVAMRYFNKSKDKISETFDINNPEWNSVLGALEEAGVLIKGKTHMTNDLIQNPYSNIEIKPSDKMDSADPKLNQAKQFIANVVSVLGAKGQHTVSETGKTSVTYESVKKLMDLLGTKGLTTDMNVFNMFANDVVSAIAYEKVIGTELTNGDVFMLQEMMTMDVPMAKYGTTGTAKGFQVKKLKKSSSMDDKLKEAIDEYNLEIDGLIKRGSKGPGKGSVITVITDSPLITDRPSVEALTDMIRRAKNKSGESATKHIIDFMNALDPNDSIRNSLAQYMNEYGVSADRLLHYLRKQTIIEVEPGTRQGLPKYIVNKEKIKEGSRLRKELENWLGTEYGLRPQDVDHLRVQAEMESNELIEQSNRDFQGNSTVTVDGFFKKWFPKVIVIDGESKTHGSRIKDYNKYLDDKLFNSIDHEINQDVVNHIIRDMEFKDSNSGEMLLGKDILKDWTSNNRNKHRYYEAVGEIMQILKTRLTTTSKRKIQFIKGTLALAEQIKARSRFDLVHERLGFDYMIVDGNMHAMFETGGKYITEKTINIFEADSNRLGSKRKTDVTKAKSHFDRMMTAVIDPIVGNGSGVSVIRFGNAKSAIGIAKSDAHKVVNKWLDEVYDVYYKKANPAEKEVLDTVKDTLLSVSEKYMDKNDINFKEGRYKASKWTKTHKMAYRSLIYKEMLTGKDLDMFLESFAWSDSKARDMLAKRFSLFDTKSANRITDDLINVVPKELRYKYGKDPVAEYKDREFGMAEWVDSRHGGIKDRIDAFIKKEGLTWDQIAGGREDASGFDSIGFISRDMRNFLSAIFGEGSEISGSYKPIISSSGKGNVLLFGKTLFVYDSLIQADIFDKKAGLDVLLTRSADKLETIKNPIDKPIDDLLNMTPSEWDAGNYMFTIKKDAVGIVGHVKKGPGALSHTLWNYMKSSEAADIFNEYYADKFDFGMGAMSRILSNPEMKSAAFRIMKGINRDVPMDDQYGSDNHSNFNNLVKWMALGDNARPNAFGEYMLNNALKKQFIDPILNQHSIADGNEFGGKAVLSQSLKLRDLEVSSVPHNNRKGEILLPYDAREGLIHFGDKNIKVRLIDKKSGKDIDAFEAFELQLKLADKTLTKKDIEDLWFQIENLGQLHDILNDKTFMGEFAGTYDVGITTTRFPRTRPNDLGLLRLKGFMELEAGQQAIINDLDVYSIFEGDYDYDKIDYFWANHPTVYNHINRTKTHWINNIDVSRFETPAPSGLSVLSKNATISENAWNELDSDNRVFARAKGTAQKTIRIYENMYELGAEYSKDGKRVKGRRRLLNFKDQNGDQVEIFIDKGTEIYHRMALESQIMIDSWKGIDKKIVDDLMQWRTEFMYPSKSESIGMEEVTKSLTPNNTSIRIFRKFVNGVEQESLNEVDKAALNSIQDNYSKFAQLQTEVWEAGQSRSPYYHDMVNMSRDYFSFLSRVDKGKNVSNLSESVFYSMVGDYGYKSGPNKSYFDAMFKTKSEVRSKSQWMIKSSDFKDFSMDNVKQDPFTHMKLGLQDSPFDQGVLDKSAQIGSGRAGSVVERSYHKIMDKDPLKTLYTDEMILTGEELNNHNKMLDLALTNATWAGSELQELIPKAVVDIKVAKRSIVSLINIRDRVKYSKNMSWKLKKARLEGIEKSIKEIEKNMYPLLSKQWFKDKKPENFPDIELVDIYRNKEIREATIQYYTLQTFRDTFKAKNYSTMMEDIRELKKMIGVEYKEMNLGFSTGYGNMSMNKEQIDRFRLQPNTNKFTLEEAIQLKIEEAFTKHGPAFLFEFAAPAYGKMALGVYEGKVIPTVMKPSSNYKRVLRFMLDQMELSYKSDRAKGEEWKTLLQSIQVRDSHFDQIFSGNLHNLPTNANELNQILHSVPDIPGKLKTFIGQNYGAVGFRKNIMHRHAFGLGPEYDTNIGFLNELLFAAKNEYGISAQHEIMTATAGISNLNQVTMESGYMNPISYHIILNNMKKELGDLGFGEAISGGITPGGGIRGLSPGNQNNPLVGMLTGTQGISFNPLRMMRGYQTKMMIKFLHQAAEVVSTSKDNGKSWESEWSIEKEGGVFCKP